MAKYKVSVCIPTYNYGRYLAETIESVLAQDFDDFELLIVDDNSSDNTSEVVARYAAQDSRVRFSVNPQNLGMVQNWNHCLELAQGEYIKFVFGDDVLASPGTLRRMVALLDADRSVSLVCSARNFIDENSKVLKIESNFCDGIFPGSDVINRCLKLQANPIGEPTVVMFRRGQGGRGFLPHYRQIVDLEMWFHLLEQGSFAYLSDPLCSFRIHQRQQTSKNRESGADIDDAYYLMQEYLDKDYVTLSPFMRAYLKYDHLYKIWKMHRQGKIARQRARDRIEYFCGMLRFSFWYPFYKSFKPFLKMYKRVLRTPPEALHPR